MVYLVFIFVCKCRPLIILILRTLSTSILPLISSIFLLQNCGNNWVYFWNECNSQNKHQFDLSAPAWQRQIIHFLKSYKYKHT